MTTDYRPILEKLATGCLDVDQALQALGHCGIHDLGFAKVDHDRRKRCGMPEVVYAGHKTPDQIIPILSSLFDHHGYALATRVQDNAAPLLKVHWPEGQHNAVARTFTLGSPPQAPPGEAGVAIVAAGTSDLPIAEEAAESAAFAGVAVERFFDVGVAGIHRLLAIRDELESAGAIVVVAGMEGALPTVVGGLVSVPLIAVPTSVGYGASFGGIAALLGMLNSCAAGVSVVNIDNGFGAGVCAARIILSARRMRV